MNAAGIADAATASTGAGGAATVDMRQPVVQGRVVAHEGRAVIVTASCTGPLDVAEIAALGGAEVAVWQPVIDPVARAVLLPDPLDGLDWSAAGLQPPSPASSASSASSSASSAPSPASSAPSPNSSAPSPNSSASSPASSAAPTVVGVVTGPSFEGRPDLVSAWMTGRRALDGWGVLLSFLDGEGRIRAAATPAEVIASAADLLRP